MKSKLSFTKTKLTAFPSHYRVLQVGEQYRPGDLVKMFKVIYRSNINGVVGTASKHVAIARRQHVRVKKQNVQVKDKPVHPVEKNPLVQFFYPTKNWPGYSAARLVRLISANDKYIVGLEVSDNNRFKKFLVSKLQSLRLLEFNPSVLNK